ncbi:MAG TPA: S-layer homology domain-containing protein [Candidatus Nitrosocosmicus sp.]|nr:S-layer homology domain-containing protein [Candidatus Nitrosocosmicus sp.]
MLVKTMGLTADFSGNFDDIDNGTYYYREIGIARKLGITAGVGNSRFEPDSPISRQGMMVMTAKALNNMKKINLNIDSTNLDKFGDKAQISPYAVPGLSAMVEAGLIEGRGKGISPLSYTNRTEAAVMLYKLYNFK